MNRPRALALPAPPARLVAWGLAIAAGAIVILAALVAGQPIFLLWGLLAVAALGALAVLAAREGTAGWLPAAVLLVAALLPARVFDLWQPRALGRSFDIVVVAALACVGLAWLTRMLVQGSAKTNRLAMPQVALLLLALGGVAIHAGDYGDLDPVCRGLIRMFVPLLGFWIVATSRLESRHTIMLVRVLLAVGALVAFLGLRWPLQLWRNPHASFLFGAHGVWAVRTITPIGGPGLSALALGMMMPVAIAMAMLDSKRLRPLWVACAFAMLAGVAMSVNRSGILGCAGAVMLFAWLNRRLVRRRPALVLAALGIAAVMVAGLVVVYRRATNFARLMHVVDMDSPSDRLRWSSARLAFEVGARRLVFGSGVGRFYPRDWSTRPLMIEGRTTARDPHCLYLEGFAEMGIPGLLVVIWLLGKPLYDFTSRRRNAGARQAALLAGFAGSALAMMMYSVTSCAVFGQLRVATVAWWIIGLGYQFWWSRPAASA
jgi:O-antigen ligase